MDSMTLYRGMDVGTAKPTRGRAPAGAAPPDRRARPVGVGQRRLVAGGAAEACRDIDARGRRVLFVGGTALYLKALLYGLFDGPPARRGAAAARWKPRPKATGAHALHARLAAVDPATARAPPPQRRPPGRPRPGSLGADRPADQRLADPVAPAASPAGGESAARADAALAPGAGVVDRPAAGRSVRAHRRPRGPDDRGRPGGGSSEAEAALTTFEPGGVPGARLQGGLRPPRREGDTGRVGGADRKTRSRQFAKRQVTWFRHLPFCRPAKGQLTFAAGGLTIV